MMTKEKECHDGFGPAYVAREAAWLKQAAAHVQTPSGDRVAPMAVVRTEGIVESAGALLRADAASCRLTYGKNGAKPVVVLDFGKPSVGGYAVFTVTAKSGTPVVRLAYACHPDGLSETGCFTRETSARYLGATVDLPILPANVNRHETYTIPRIGKFIAPLIQGQMRYMRVQLDTPETSVEISDVVMVNACVYDRSPHDGHFLCSDERLNRLWYISAWTLQLASFPNHDAWKAVDGWLLPRKLEQSDEVGMSKEGADWRDVAIETTFELRANPHHASAAGVAFRALDTRNAYLAEVSLDGRFRLIRRQDRNDTVLSVSQLAAPLVDGRRYALAIEARGATLVTRLDGATIDETRDNTFQTGRVGFYTPKEKWPLFDSIRVTDGQGQALLFDDFDGDLSQWEFARTLPYVADGAKRDRLVWSGDLYFAQRTIYHAFADPVYMRGALKMLAFNQTPEGYVQAAPYPECSVAPASGDYGPFPSDEFAAWLIPVAWDHLLYTGDTATMRDIYPAITRLLGYLKSHIGADSLFVQRAETSKHAGNLDLGDTRTRAYMNILLWRVFSDAARIADHLGLAQDSHAARQTAEAICHSLFERLWDEADGYFREALETPAFGFEANALALAMGLVSAAQAARIAPRLVKTGHGKFQSLASRGKFEYGFAQSGLRALFDHSWLSLLDDSWAGAATTTECMGLITKGWGDESHPDTAIADHFSAYILGVQPTEPGFSRFRVRPMPVREVRWAKGLIPTPHGPIAAAWELSGTTFRLTLTVPQGTLADVALPEGGTIRINGSSGRLCDLPAGHYTIEASDLPAGAWSDPTLAAMAHDHAISPTATAASQQDADGFGLACLFAPESEAMKKGCCSAPHVSENAVEWIEIDLGSETELSKIVLLPGDTMAATDGARAGFPRDFIVQLAREPGAFTTVAAYSDQAAPDATGLSIELYTVIGYPSARYVRLMVTRLGASAMDEPGSHR